MQNWCMMLFFTSIGYMASVNLIKKGGLLVIKMAVLVGILIIIQNLIGISLSQVFGENPLMGLADGSIPLVGGHGTSGSFGPVLESMGLSDATTIAFAAATFGLVSGSFIGGPIGELLIRRFHLTSSEERKQTLPFPKGKWDPIRRRRTMRTPLPITSIWTISCMPSASSFWPWALAPT